MREAANAAQLKRNFAGSDLLYVPEIYWDYCRPNVLDDGAHLRHPSRRHRGAARAGTDIRRLAENGVEIFFTQVFRHNFFHADMHPGNIFVDVTDPAAAEVRRRRLRHRRHARRARSALSRREFPRVLQARLPPRREPARRFGLGAGRHARRRARGRRARGLRADLQQAAQGHLVRARAAAAVSDGAPVQHGGAAAARAAAEDAARDRGLRPAALPRARSVEDGEARARAMDARAPRSAHALQAARRSVARDQRATWRCCRACCIARCAAPTPQMRPRAVSSARPWSSANRVALRRGSSSS